MPTYRPIVFNHVLIVLFLTNLIQDHYHHVEVKIQIATGTNAFSTCSITPSFLTTTSSSPPTSSLIRTQLLNDSGDYNDNVNKQEEQNQQKKQDVNNLFATYMAQRKDKGFMDKKYNTDKDSLSESNNSNNSDDWGDGIGSTSSPSRMMNNDLADDGNSDKGKVEEGNGEAQRRRLGSNIPGIRRFLSSNERNDTTKRVVQHIPLSRETGEQKQSGDNSSSTSAPSDSSTKPPNPPSLLEQDVLRINANYEKFYDQMKDQLNELKSQNPGNVPDNVEEILSKVIEEQKAYDMKEVKNQRAMESFDEYYEKRMKEKLAESLATMNTSGANNNDNTSSNSESNGSSINSYSNGSGGDNSASLYNKDPIVKEIVEEATKEQQFRMEQKEQYRKYKEYEESLKRNLTKTIDSDTAGINSNKTDKKTDTNISGTVNSIDDFDEMQLKVLKDLLEKRQQRSSDSKYEDEDLYLTDNIEDGIEELQEKIDNKELDANKYRPETLKEWQMYRAIATKLANTKRMDDDDLYDSFGSGETPDGILLDIVDQDDADVVRKKVEAWKEFQMKEEEMRKQAGLAIKYRPPFEWSDKPEPEEDSLLPSKANKPFDMEKAEEARSELDQLALQVLKDLMMKTTDTTRREKIKNEIEALKVGIQARQKAMKDRGPVVAQKKAVIPIDINSALGRGQKSSTEKKNEIEDQSSQTNEPGKSEDIDEDLSSPIEEEFEYDYLVEDVSNDGHNEERPDSQFFRDLEEDMDLSVSNISNKESTLEEEIEINLGTMEEQKFRSMVARSGVRTIEEQNKLKEEWEDFQRVEQMMREKTGLSGVGKMDESVAKSKYDVENMFKDGDIDADTILGVIGKRPSKKNRTSQTSSTAEENLSKQTKENIFDESKVDDNVQNASGSDTSNDFRKDLDQEERKLNDGIGSAPSKDTSAIKVSSEKGSLTFGKESDPQKQFISKSFSSFDARKSDLLEYSLLSVAQLNTLMGLKRSVYSTGVSPYLARVNKPFQEFGAIFMLEGVLADLTGLQFEAWKRTARIYDFKIPTLEDTKYASVHAEDYAVQKVFFWTDDIFALKKVVETFKEKRFEVFQEWQKEKSASRSDSDLISPNLSNGRSPDDIDVSNDVMNIQVIAWQKAATDFGFEAPTLDLVNIVGSLAPDEAVRAIFKWTNDFVMSNNVASSYRKYLKEETSKWMSSRPKPIETSPRTSIKNDSNSKIAIASSSSPTMEDYLQLKLQAWETVAKSHNLDPPSLNQVNIAEFAGPEKAVISVFKWTDVDEECKDIIASYRKTLKVLTQEWVEKTGSQGIQSTSSLAEEEIESIPLFILREGAENWLSSIQEVHVPSVVISDMDEKLMDGILEEAGLSRFFPLDKRISSSSGYEISSQKMLGAALRAERRPDHCVVFSATPQSATDAHEVEMKNIALVSPYPYYELTTSDMTVRDFKSIGMMNLKNVFSETVGEEPMQQLQVESPRIQRKTLQKTRFWDDGGR